MLEEPPVVSDSSFFSSSGCAFLYASSESESAAWYALAMAREEYVERLTTSIFDGILPARSWASTPSYQTFFTVRPLTA